MTRVKIFFLRLPLNTRFFLIAILFGILPMILFSGISFVMSCKIILNNAMVDLLGTAKKNNEVIEIQLKRVEESALIFTVDKNLSEYLESIPEMKECSSEDQRSDQCLSCISGSVDFLRKQHECDLFS